MTRGVVVAWYDEEGWGVLRSPDLPSDVFAHFSVIAQIGRGYRSLSPGRQVHFTWEARPQDGYAFSAIEVFIEGEAPSWGREPENSGPGYSSSLRIEFDDD
ncbi:cold shock domain-containing protein [Sphaerimonospora mesophila]|uniref:cold-shock protein n=1 Tax=Sphaerimonospora mesophila TaxID=37483 RepID=UPI0007C74D62